MRIAHSQTTATLFAFAAAMTAACSSDASQVSPNNSRDSAGIRIIESSAPIVTTSGAWTISPTPVIEIGANELDSTQTLDRVEGAVRLSDGNIVISNGAAPALRWYDTKGAFVQGAGRFGQGPGEFDSGEGGIWIYAVWALPGDSVATWEHSRRRMQVFDPKGRYVRAVVIDLPPNMPPAAYPQISGRTTDGLLAMLLDERVEDGPLGVVKRDSAAFLRYTADGKFARQLVRLPGFVHYTAEIKRPGMSQPFRAALSPPFSPVLATWPDGDQFYYSDSERYEIAVYDSTGVVRALIRRLGPRRAVTSEIIGQYRQTRLAAAGDNPERRRDTEEMLKTLPFPDSLPALRRLRVDREGMLWVQEYSLPGKTSVLWSVFDKEGRWLTDVSIPTAWQIQDIGRDYIITIETTELDVERVRMYSLMRGRN